MVHCLIWRDWGAPQGWRASDEATGGIHLELSIHYLDLIDWMVSGGDARIYTAGGKSLGTAITDHFWMTMSYDSGVLANLGLAIFAPAENVIPLEIVGDKGRIRGDIITGRVEVWLRDGIVRDVSPSRPPNYHFDGFPGSLESLASFLQCVATGSEPIAGIDAATRATALALAARASEESGLPVTVPDHK
jgi:predicted dehydrogenase